MEPFTIGTTLGTVGASLITGIVGGWMIVRRKMSRDGVELTKDRSEINIIELLTKQRDEAVDTNLKLTEKLSETTTEKDRCVNEMIQLKEDITKLNQQLRLMNSLVKRLSNTLDYTKTELKKIVEQQNKKDPE